MTASSRIERTHTLKQDLRDEGRIGAVEGTGHKGVGRQSLKLSTSICDNTNLLDTSKSIGWQATRYRKKDCSRTDTVREQKAHRIFFFLFFPQYSRRRRHVLFRNTFAAIKRDRVSPIRTSDSIWESFDISCAFKYTLNSTITLGNIRDFETSLLATLALKQRGRVTFGCETSQRKTDPPPPKSHPIVLNRISR